MDGLRSSRGPTLSALPGKFAAPAVPAGAAAVIVVAHHPSLFQKAKDLIPEFENSNTFEKFKALLTCREPKVIHALGDFLNKSM